MIGEDTPVWLQELCAFVVEVRRFEIDDRISPVEQLIDRFAIGRIARVVAERLDGGWRARALEVELRVRDRTRSGTQGARVVDIDVDLCQVGSGIGEEHAHESKAFRREAVVTGRVRAGVPFDALEVDPIKVRKSVKATANSGTARSGRAVGVVVGRVNISG